MTVAGLPGTLPGMTLVTRTLTNAGDALCGPNGVALDGVNITFTLVADLDQATAVWDATTHERVTSGPITVTTAAGGFFSVALWPNSRGNVPSTYLCKVDHRSVPPFRGSVDDVVGTL